MQKKSLLTIVLSLVLVAVIGVGSTLAFMSQRTEQKHNVFTAGSSLTGALKEQRFDGGDYNAAQADIDKFTTEDALKDSPVLGFNRAKLVMPGRIIPKDPIVMNTSDKAKGTKAWVAIKIDAKFGDEINTKKALESIEKIAIIDWDIGWSDVTYSADGTAAYFFYNAQVPPQDETTHLFRNVIIRKEAAVADLNDFSIDVTAALVQANGVDSIQSLESAKPELVKLLSPAV
jgi:predicted ribosomally synthesized peptide with SipW-like signal peptide